MTVTKGMRQAYDMQDLAYEASMAIRDNLKRDTGVLSAPDKETAMVLTALNKAWRDAQEQVRIHRGKPLPGSLTHEKVGRKRATRASLSALSALAARVERDDDDARAMPDATPPNDSDTQPNDT